MNNHTVTFATRSTNRIAPARPARNWSAAAMAGNIDIQTAMAINSAAQTLIASAKVEVDYVKSIGGMNDRVDFIEPNAPIESLRLVK